MDKDLPQIKLEKAEFDFTQVRVQALWGIFLLLAVGLAHYVCTLNVGFLLDDFLHFDYAAKALSGDTQAFVQNFTGNWAGSDIMKSYRPLVSLSFFTDALLFGANSVGFHWTNIILFLLCCFFTTLVSLELTGLYGNRLGAIPAIWAGFLFALYPLHPESVAWVIGRVDLLCALFYLASLWAYMRFRLLGENAYLKGALICFALSFVSKEMAVTLPLVITLAELLLYGKDSTAKPQQLRQRGFFVLSFWLALAVLTVIRSLLIGSVVGGYGSAGIFELVLSLRTFIDKASLWKLFVPLNEEMVLSNFFTWLNFAGYAIVAVIFMVRLALAACPWRPFVFLGLSLVVMLLPTFQIWHIHPNLVGSRLFFLSSAPLCMFIALAALPAFDKIGKRLAISLTCLGSLALLLLTIGWSTMLDTNLKPWIQAGHELNTLHKQVIGYTNKGSAPLLINLPQDVHGAGILTRPLYLGYLLVPPLSPGKRELKFSTIEPAISGSHDFLWPERLKSLASNINDKFIWNRDEGRFVPWTQARAGKEESVDLYRAGPGLPAVAGIDPADTAVVSGNSWHFVHSLAPSVVQYDDKCRLYPGRESLCVSLRLPEQLDPLTLNVAEINMRLIGSAGSPSGLNDKVKLCWQGVLSPNMPINTEASLSNKSVSKKTDGNYTVWLGRYRQWSLLNKVNKLSLVLAPGDYYVDLYSVVLSSSTAMVPKLNAELEKQGIKLSYDASKLKPSFVRILGSQVNNTFDANSEAELHDANPATTKLGFEQEIKGATGNIALSQGQLVKMTGGKPGIIQFRAVAIDEKSSPLGLPGEPVSVRFNDAGSMEIIR